MSIEVYPVGICSGKELYSEFFFYIVKIAHLMESERRNLYRTKKFIQKQQRIISSDMPTVPICLEFYPTVSKICISTNWPNHSREYQFIFSPLFFAMKLLVVAQSLKVLKNYFYWVVLMKKMLKNLAFNGDP